jgi:hypothetical protein
MRVARALSVNGDPRSIARVPYIRTLWAFLHICQQERLDALKVRSQQLALGTLIMLAFHKPDALNEVRQTLMVDAGLTPTLEHVLATSQGILADVAKLDAFERAGRAANRPEAPAPVGFVANSIAAGSGQMES